MKARLTQKEGQQGFALAGVLWFLAILFVAATGASFINQVNARYTIYVEEKARAYFLAREGLARAEEGLSRLWAEMNPRQAKADGAWVAWSSPEGGGRYAILNEQGKLNLNRVPAARISTTLMKAGMEQEEAETLADALGDWTDPDALLRDKGAERDYYLDLDPPYEPRNGPFQSLAEIALVRGVSPGMLFGDLDQGLGQGLWGLFTLYTKSLKIDINAASPAVLMALPGVDEEIVRLILERRALGPFPSLETVRDTVGDLRFRSLGPSLTVDPSRVYTILSQAEAREGQARHNILAVVEILRNGQVKHYFWIDDLNWPKPRPKEEGEGEKES